MFHIHPGVHAAVAEAQVEVFQRRLVRIFESQGDFLRVTVGECLVEQLVGHQDARLLAVGHDVD